MSNFWHFYITDHDNLSITHIGMHWLDMTMAAHLDVHQIVYAMMHLPGCLANEGYICFTEAKNITMVQVLLPEFWVRMCDYYGDSISYVNYLHLNNLNVKFGIASWVSDMPVIFFDIQWHYINLITNKHFNGCCINTRINKGSFRTHYNNLFDCLIQL